MHLNPTTGALAHLHFSDLPSLLDVGDVLVLNDTKVMNARFLATRATGGKVEVFLLEPLTGHEWLVLLRPASRLQVGERIQLGEQLVAVILEKHVMEGRHRIALESPLPIDDAIARFGHSPLPPYIHPEGGPKLSPDDYQTVYAKSVGAVAAPTAGLHFTEALMDALIQKGVLIETLTLHVGYGTFTPIEVANITDHQMHPERYSIREEVAERLTRAKTEGRRIVAVGTTSARSLESAWNGDKFQCGDKSTSLYITPGYTFRAVDGLVTNFHLPKSSLMVLVSALAGVALIREAYTTAIAQHYRFYSFGDAMLIGPTQCSDRVC